MVIPRRLLPVAIALGLLAGSAAPAHAQAGDARIVSEKPYRPRVLELTISTPAFATPTKVDVDLPVGYDADPKRRWPVTYVLAGTMNTYRTFNTLVDGVKLTEKYPSIVVSPNGDSGYWSDWYNAGKLGPPMYETYVAKQLIPLIDARFRTVASRSQRAVFGISMGGYGAAMMAARHPDLFAAAATLSGAVDSNLAPQGAVLSISPTFQNEDVDAIYGPRATQEVRWRGHNPTDLASNLRDLDLQVRTANGVLNPGIGEQPASADSVSCVVEGGVHMSSVSFNDTLDALRIPHLWKDYGPGCHSRANFTREIADTFSVFEKVLEKAPAAPTRFEYKSIEPAFDVYGWHVAADPKRPLEFLQLSEVSASGLTIAGSGITTITTPPLFAGLKRVDLGGAKAGSAVPDAQGRITFPVDLGAPNPAQQYASGATTKRTSRRVAFRPRALIKVGQARAKAGSVRVCARTIGGAVTATVRVVDAGGKTVARGDGLALNAKTACRSLPLTGGSSGRNGRLLIAGRDGFGHRISGRRTIRLP